jgi:hypothetical protein
MKHIQCKLRTSEAVHDWLRFVASVEHLASASKFRVNGKVKNSDGFYSALQCEVESENIIDFLTEYLAFIEKRDSLSFDISVKDGDDAITEEEVTDEQP